MDIKHDDQIYNSSNELRSDRKWATMADAIQADAERLLEISKRANDAREIARTNTASYNIFDVLNLNSDEVNCHCRFLHDLLSPRGNHGQGTLFLEEFFRTVLKQEPGPWVAEAEISREKSFMTSDVTGRIDLLITCKQECCIVIEVKVFAPDQERQIARYHRFAEDWKKRNGNHGSTGVYYLTLFGKEAPHFSTEGIKRADNKEIYEPISFSKHILDWLEKCRDLLSTSSQPEGNPQLVVMLDQYINLVHSLTANRKEDVLTMEVAKLISQSKDSYEAAVQIEDALNKARAEKLNEIFTDMRNYLDKTVHCQMLDVPEFERDLDRYYKPYSKTPLPRLLYPIVQSEDKIVALTIELGRRLYAGLTFFEKKQQENDEIEIARIDEDREWLNGLSENREWSMIIRNAPANDWWLHWINLEDEGAIDFSVWADVSHDPKGVEYIDFRNFENNYERLFDREAYQEWMQKICARLSSYVDAVKTLGIVTC